MRCWTQLHQTQGKLTVKNNDPWEIDFSNPQIKVSEIIPWEAYEEALASHSPRQFSFRIQDWLLANVHSQYIFDSISAAESFLTHLITESSKQKDKELASHVRKIKNAINTVFEKQSFSIMQDKLIQIIANMILAFRIIEKEPRHSESRLLTKLDRAYIILNDSLYWHILSRNNKLENHQYKNILGPRRLRI
ncbi:MAG: hypothetical protein WC205_15185 [Opitutaceae bacterium]|jgi:hypothetical protein